MKHEMLLIAVLSTFILVQCDTEVNPEAEEGDTETELSPLKSEVQREDPEVSDPLLDSAVSGNTGFAADMYKSLAEDKHGEDIFFSPFSISIAFGMTWAGAQGTTAEEISEVFKFRAGEETHQAFNHLDQEMEDAAGSNEDLDLSIVNALWGEKTWSNDFKTPYLDRLAKHYGGGLTLLDFKAAPEPSREEINLWVSDKTEDLIQDLLPQGSITSLTRFVLTNAIYFKGLWLNHFDKDLTEDDTFYKPNGDSVEVPMMTASEEGKESVQYAAANEMCTAVDLPYKGDRFSMLLIRPRNRDLYELESEFDREFIENVVSDLDSMPIVFKMPKFEIKGKSISLKSILSDMGLSAAFSPDEADFSGIIQDRDLFISDAIHKAYIKVDESGTEAAAATAVVMATTSIGPSDEPVFIMNRPFIYLIRDRETGSILFAGRMMNPLE